MNINKTSMDKKKLETNLPFLVIQVMVERHCIAMTLYYQWFRDVIATLSDNI